MLDNSSLLFYVRAVVSLTYTRYLLGLAVCFMDYFEWKKQGWLTSHFLGLLYLLLVRFDRLLQRLLRASKARVTATVNQVRLAGRWEASIPY